MYYFHVFYILLYLFIYVYITCDLTPIISGEKWFINVTVASVDKTFLHSFSVCFYLFFSINLIIMDIDEVFSGIDTPVWNSWHILKLCFEDFSWFWKFLFSIHCSTASLSYFSSYLFWIFHFSSMCFSDCFKLTCLPNEWKQSTKFLISDIIFFSSNIQFDSFFYRFQASASILHFSIILNIFHNYFNNPVW